MIERIKCYLRRYPLLVQSYRALLRKRDDWKNFPITLFSPKLSVLKAVSIEQARQDLDDFLFSGLALHFSCSEQPLVSVILVAHNRAELTLACLRSLLQERGLALEVIIVDNCSTDQSQRLYDLLIGVKVIRNLENRHFLLAANQAARSARGRYLLFLNNDAQILPGSIKAAVNVFSSIDNVGAVGGRLILADNRLQEAGSIVWRDGGCLGYGRGDHPLHCQYMFRREVDFCSGAFLVTPRYLFEDLAGFDEAYQPAYYEEADYCLRLRQLGWKVIHEPRVAVRHYEFASSKGSKEALLMQQGRRATFLEKQADILRHRLPPSPKHILQARMLPLDRPRLLFIDDRLPHRAMGSGYPRANQMVRAALANGWFVSILPALDVALAEDWSSVYTDIPAEVEVLAFAPYGPLGVKRLLAERSGYYQAVLISRPQTMKKIGAVLRSRPKLFAGAKVIYDAEAVCAFRDILYAQLQGKPRTEEQVDALVKAELSLAQGLDHVVAVSEAEAVHFHNCGFSDVHVISHAVDIVQETPEFSRRGDILFLGAMSDETSPNADSMHWFLDNILSELRKMGFEENFVIAGTNADQYLKPPLPPGVRVLGYVPDPAVVYAQSRIFVAPTRFSAGIPLKIIEAAAHGLPAVGTSLVGRQLGWQDGQDILLADDPRDFAEKCLLLGSDREVWEHIRNNAQERVRREYSFSAMVRNLARVLN